MLSTSAFNALLKTLEEPPSHVRFMFATTEVHKVPATILSRCQRFDLRRISTRDIMDRLALIADAEDVKMDEAAMLAIARGAEGGLRDAQSALDQMIAFQGKEISEEDVLSVFGLVSWSAIEALSDAILNGDIPAIISAVEELDHNGKDLLRLVLDLIGHFRNLLVLQHSGDETVHPDWTTAQAETLLRQKSLRESEHVLRILRLLTDVETRIRAAISRRTLLELTLIRCARAATTVSVEQLMRELQALKNAPVAEAPPPPSATEPAPSDPPPEKKKTPGK